MLLPRFKSLAVSVALGVGLLAGSLQPMPAAAGGGVPACRFDDLAASPRAYSDWNKTVLDTIYKLPANYKPPQLVSTKKAGLSGGGTVRSFAIPDLAAMATAARRAGAGLRVVSAYRSYATQVSLYQREVRRYGPKIAMHSVARPGHSEHQLGVTIDFGAARQSGSVSQTFARTAAGRWMKSNGWKYGWVMSYPSGKTSKTCYYSEPWHFRYVGRSTAAKVHASGYTLREYLWQHYR